MPDAYYAFQFPMLGTHYIPAYDALPEHEKTALARAKTAKEVCPCCTCDGGAHLYGCVPTRHYYILAGCAHLCLCPQQRCDPMCKGGFCDTACCTHVYANFPVCWLSCSFGNQSPAPTFPSMTDSFTRTPSRN